MNYRILSIIFILTLFSLPNVIGQSNYDKALELRQKAINLMDNEHANESIILLKQACRLDLDSNNIIYKYEIACAQYIKQDYRAAIRTLKKILNNNKANDKVYQLLGNSYDFIGRSKHAFEVYNLGLKKFPNSGRLYLELGVMELKKSNYEMALSLFEKGIYVAPCYSSNYYWASKIYFGTSNKLCGLIYGEIFMNLERIGTRVEEISELLYVITKKSLISSDSTIALNFDKNILKGEPYILNDSLKCFQFNIMYKSLLSTSLSNIKNIDMDVLSQIRIDFIKKYFSEKIYNKFPNSLFEYQYKLFVYGYFDAYNHWLLKSGNQNEFGLWYEKNKVNWDNFVDWFLRNSIHIDEFNRFFSSQYQ
jgi:tetratricopeptide (TPR) repeat protein